MFTLYSSTSITGIGATDLNIEGELSVIEANTLDDLTEGTITGSISASERVSSLIDLTGNNDYGITISEEDAISSSVSDLNTINGKTTLFVNLSNVQAITSLSLIHI